MSFITKPLFRRVALPALFIALGFVAGLTTMVLLDDGPNEGSSVAGFPSTRLSIDSSDSGHSESISAKESSEQEASLSQADSHAFSDLETLDSDFSRNVALFNLLEDANESALRELIRQSAAVSPASRRRDIQVAIFRRYTQLDPVSALSETERLAGYQQNFLVPAVFREWSQLDLDGAVGAAKQLKGENKRAAIRAVMEARDDLSQQMRQQLAVQMGNEELGLAVIDASWKYEAIDNPAPLFDEVINDSVRNWVQNDMLVRVAEEWIERDGIHILKQISAKISSPEDQYSVLQPIVRSAAESNPVETLEVAQTLSRGHRETALEAVARIWAQSNGSEALAGVSTVTEARTRKRLQEAVIYTWGGDNPRDLLQHLHLVPENLEGKAYGAVISTIAGHDPDEAAGLLKLIKDDRIRTPIEDSFVYQWSRQNADGALNWVLSDAVDPHQRTSLLGTVLMHLVIKDPERAMSLALKHPVKDGELGLETDVISGLVYHDVDAAIELLPRVREEFALWTYLRVGNELLEIDRALKLGDQLNKNLQQQYYEGLIQNWSYRAPDLLLDAIETLPSNELKSLAALRIINYNDSSHELSDERVRYARTFLTDKDREELDRLLQ